MRIAQTDEGGAMEAHLTSAETSVLHGAAAVAIPLGGMLR
jgi:hypothetical protein